MSANPLLHRWVVAAWGGFFGVMFAFFVSAFSPRPFESSIKIQLNEPDAWLLTPGFSTEQFIKNLRSEAVLSQTVESCGLKSARGVSAEASLKEAIRAEEIPDTYLIKVTVRRSDGGNEDLIVTSLLKHFDDIFTADFKKRAMLNLTEEFEGKKVKRDQLEKVRSNIQKIMPEYFNGPSTDCGSGSDPEFQRFSARLKAYDEKRSTLEQTNPQLVYLVKEHDELAASSAAIDPRLWTIRSIPYTCVRVIEEASPPVRSSLSNLTMILACGGGTGFLTFLLSSNNLVALLGGRSGTNRWQRLR